MVFITKNNVFHLTKNPILSSRIRNTIQNNIAARNEEEEVVD